MKAQFVQKEPINENIKFEKHEYSKFYLKDGYVYASKEGILGFNKTFIPWDTIRQIMKKLAILF